MNMLYWTTAYNLSCFTIAPDFFALHLSNISLNCLNFTFSGARIFSGISLLNHTSCPDLAWALVCVRSKVRLKSFVRPFQYESLRRVLSTSRSTSSSCSRAVSIFIADFNLLKTPLCRLVYPDGKSKPCAYTRSSIESAESSRQSVHSDGSVVGLCVPLRLEFR
jgi:hypothetical protein